MLIKMKKGIKLYAHYVSINIRSMMQYKTSFLLTTLGQFLVSFNVFLGIYFMFQRFQSVEGYTYSEVLMCFSIILLEFSFAEMIARGFDAFSEMVRTGKFDLVLVRPQNEILQVLGSKFELTRIGRMIQAIVMFGYAVIHSNIEWNVCKIITIVFMIIGGTAVFSGLFLIYAALCFFTLEGLEFMNVFTDGAREFGKYPMDIYGKKMLVFATFIIPYALVQYYPLLYILDHNSSLINMFIPLCALLFLVPCYLIWRLGVRHYTSSGS